MGGKLKYYGILIALVIIANIFIFSFLSKATAQFISDQVAMKDQFD